MNVTVGQRRNIFLICCLPFFVNDFGFIAFNGSYQIYLIDYAVRILIIAFCLYWSTNRPIACERIHSGSDHLLTMIAGVFVPISVHLIIDSILPDTSRVGWGRLFDYPEISNQLLFWIDLTIGLFLVAVTEELVFRKFAFGWLSRLTENSLIVIIISAILFALIHWGLGSKSVMSNFIMGMVFMLIFIKIKRLWPLIVSHWIINFLVFMKME